MMRRGLWQQKQRRPSACLLRRFTYSYGPYTRPSLRPASSPDGTPPTSSLDSLSPTLLPTLGHSSRPYSVAAGRDRHGGEGLSKRGPLQRPFSTNALPSWATQQPHTGAGDAGPGWATQQPQSAAGNDGLLPHERAAREKAMSRASAPPATPANDAKPNPQIKPPATHARAAGGRGSMTLGGPAAREQATGRTRPSPAFPSGPAGRRTTSGLEGWAGVNRAAPAQRPPAENAGHLKPAQRAGAGGLAPRWPAMQRPPMPAPRSAAPAWTSASPSWPTSDPDPGKPPQQASPLESILPHERAAREKATARTQPQAASPPPATSRSPAQPARPPPQSDPFSVSRPSPQFPTLNSSQQPRRTRDSSATATQSRRDRSSDNESEYPDVDWDALEKAASSRSDLRRASSALAQTPADKGDWKNLARRERSPTPFGVSPSWATYVPPPPSSLGQAAGPLDPISELAPNAVARTATSGSSDSGVDQWKLMEQSEADMKRAERKRNATAGAATWDWTEDARKEQGQRIARDMSQETEPSRQDIGRGDRSRRDNGRVDRSRRETSDRYAPKEREDRWGNKIRKPTPQANFRDREDENWDDDFHDEKRRRKAERAERERRKRIALGESSATAILLPEFISVAKLAGALGQRVDRFVRQLEDLGFEDVGKDNILTGETAALVAQEYGFEPTVSAGEDEDLKPAPAPADPASLPPRPPVVTIMGHVDHGKTTLLDYLRKSSIVAQEHGGITQHIGAFSVSLSTGKQITFLDTPGHAAFLSMRQRGANVTDMVILVVAADDSVMPQTLEALRHARAAKVPIIVAINKVDKPEANVERVKSDLALQGVELEDYGGDVQVVCVSGRTGQGMNDLEENILLLSEMLDIRAEPDGMAEGWVLESTIKPIGRVATVLVKRGTLRPGDFIVAGCVHAKIRSLRNEAGAEVDEAPPGTAVEVLGWKEPPEAGDQALQAPDESKAKAAVRYRQELKQRSEIITQMAQQEQDRRDRERERALAEAPSSDPTATDPANPPAETTKFLTFLVKGDVHGSVEAVTAALLEQGNNEIRARMLVSAPGHITESEVELAAVSGSTIVNFNNPIPSTIKRLAHDAGVPILDHKVIYHLVEEVRGLLAEALPPLVSWKVVGEAEVLQIFPINVRGRVMRNIAGCRVGNGYVKKGARARVLRGGENVYEGTVETLRQVKKDVEEMKKGSECGLSLGSWDELQAGDRLQFIEEVSEKRTL